MSSSVMTKKIFAEALKKLMLTTPFAKISIVDITNECDMNRNSFYYHFKDKYELLNWIFLTEVTETVNGDRILEMSNWDILDSLCEYFFNNNQFYANAMSYEGQNSFNAYFRELLELALKEQTVDLFVNEEDPIFKEFCVVFTVDAIIVTIERWIKNGAEYPPEQFVSMLKRITSLVPKIMDMGK